MSSEVISSRWRLVLVLVAVFCVMSAGGIYTYAVLSDTESVEITIEGASSTVTTPDSLSDAIATVNGAPVGSQLVADELPGDPPGG